MPTRQEHIHKRLIEEGEKVAAMFESLPLDQRACIIYTEGATWTVKDILAHQLTTERAVRRLLDDILAGGAGAPEDFSIDAFNQSQAARMAARTWEDLIAAFRVARTDMATFALRLTAEQLALRGRHPFLGVTSVENILQLLYRHNMLHAHDIRQALRQ
jgi:hypothetical protein